MAKGSGGTRARMPASYKYAPNFASHDSTIEVHKRIASNAVARLRRIINDKERDGFTRDATQFKFGTLSNTLAKKYQEVTGIKIINRDMYTGASSLFHHRGGNKAENGKETSFEDIANMPMNIGTMDVYVHSGAIVFTDYKNKFVLQPNQKVKINREKTIVTNHLSSSRVKDKNAFDVEHGYMKIK